MHASTRFHRPAAASMLLAATSAHFSCRYVTRLAHVSAPQNPGVGERRHQTSDMSRPVQAPDASSVSHPPILASIKLSSPVAPDVWYIVSPVLQPSQLAPGVGVSKTRSRSLASFRDYQVSTRSRLRFRNLDLQVSAIECKTKTGRLNGRFINRIFTTISYNPFIVHSYIQAPTPITPFNHYFYIQKRPIG
ncbi:hypothetical protein BKA58DRAFT_75624 [Alternaria rosae]|uniref:uncharacterized protein n=1 Tax=Alternaria rosae TaxID=1187941 RepID=UPI001E8D7565|nr:uncharacterized protein BKA58DRAFT_75624 [Alternaria rosae]KAH6877506.1 hypothetical protein BKA58DRAFT_75624 [Alternaria rosae]